MAIMYTAERDMNNNTYEGHVLAKVVDQNYRIMSDVWGTADFALVWDEATASPKQILINVYDMCPDGWCPVQIKVDATEEIKAKYLNWKVNCQFNSLLYGAEKAALRIEKGCIAKVVKGKTGKGTIGKVVVIMDGAYGMGWKAVPMKKYAIATSDVQIDKALRNGKVVKVYQDVVWAWACNVERQDIAEIDKEALLEQAQKSIAMAA